MHSQVMLIDVRTNQFLTQEEDIEGGIGGNRGE